MTDEETGVVRVNRRTGQRVVLLQARQAGREPNETDGDAVLFLAEEDIPRD